MFILNQLLVQMDDDFYTLSNIFFSATSTGEDTVFYTRSFMFPNCVAWT
jgi:hypothetical protein